MHWCQSTTKQNAKRVEHLKIFFKLKVKMKIVQRIKKERTTLQTCRESTIQINDPPDRLRADKKMLTLVWWSFPANKKQTRKNLEIKIKK